MKPEVLEMGPMYPPTQAALEAAFTVHKLWLAPDRDALIASLAPRITAVASSGRAGIDAATIAKLPKVKIISHFGVGVDTVDTEAAKRHGVTVTNTPDVLTEDVADIAIALLLATVRKVAAGDRYVRDGKWLKGSMPLTDTVQGKTLGVVGLGRIGRAVANRARAFGMRVAYTRGAPVEGEVAEAMPLDRLLSTSDVVSLHCPLTPDTRHLIDQPALARMKRSAYLINASRGPIVDEAALAWALKNRLIAGAGLDVYEDEPRVHPDLLGLDNVVLVPHLGSATTETRTAMADLAAQNVVAVVTGRPPLTPVS